MSHEKLYLRFVKPADIDILFEWANDEAVRANGFHTGKIPYDEHQRWFEALLKDESQVQYILMRGEEAVGQVRLSVKDHCAEVHYSISPQNRNMGLGKALIQLIQNKVYEEYPDIYKLTAKVKPTNIASIQCFEKNGFSETFIQYELKRDFFRLGKENDDIISGRRE